MIKLYRLFTVAVVLVCAECMTKECAERMQTCGEVYTRALESINLEHHHKLRDACRAFDDLKVCLADVCSDAVALLENFVKRVQGNEFEKLCGLPGAEDEAVDSPLGDLDPAEFTDQCVESYRMCSESFKKTMDSVKPANRQTARKHLCRGYSESISCASADCSKKALRAFDELINELSGGVLRDMCTAHEDLLSHGSRSTVSRFLPVLLSFPLLFAIV